MHVVFEALGSAKPGDVLVIDNAGRRDEGCFGDLLEDGVVFLPGDRSDELFDLAETINTNEARQIDAFRAGHSLREQMKFDEYLKLRAADPARRLTFSAERS